MKLFKMKNRLTLLSVLFLCVISVKAQLNFSLPSSTDCHSTSNIMLTVTGTVSGATSYAWSIASPTCNPTYTASPSGTTTPPGSSLIVNFPCGSSSAHTITCYALNGTSTLSTLSQTCIILFGNINPMTVSPGTGSGCNGTTFTLTNSSAASYTINPGNITGGTALLTPTAFSCYTIIATAASGCTTDVSRCLTVTPQPTVTVVAAPSIICAGQTTTLSASGATTYSWAPGGYSGATVMVSPSVATQYTVYASNASGCASQMTVNVGVNPNPVLTALANPSVICPGQTATLTVGGATSYTWLPGAGMGSSYAATPTISTNYIVIGSNGTCTTQTNAIVLVSPSPTVAVNSSNTICAGSMLSLSASGGLTYTWIPGNLTGPSVNITPTTNITFTVFAANATGCVASNTIAVNVLPLPTITILGNNSPICSGSNATLVATGAAVYAWSNGVAGSLNIVSPPSSFCYSVMGTSAMGCTNIAAACVTVDPTPTLSVSGNFTVCKGSSTNLSVSGANTYTWSTSATTSSVNILPYWTLNYTVSGTTNGCSSSYTVTVVRDSSCADVWPGDANSDGVVNSSDVFELGLAFNNTGPARTPGGNAYNAQYASNWSGLVSTGKNQCHADCNGDGTINNSDTLAIFNNYLLTHSFKSSGTAASGDINIVATQATEGVWNKADIVLGSPANPISNLYGVAFDIDFDNSLIETNSAYIVYTPSFLNASSQNIQFRKTNYAGGKVHAASVRVNGADVNGNGKIGEFWFKVKSDVPANSSLNLSVSNAQKIDHAAVSSAVTGGNTNVAVEKVYVGLKESISFDQSLQFFPNPAGNQLSLRSEIASAVAYTVSDPLGREVAKGEFVQATNVELSSIQSGTYLIRFADGKNVAYKKLVIEK